MSLINLLLSSLILNFFYVIIASRMSQKKIYIRDKNVLLSLLFLIISVPVIFIFFDDFIRVILDFTVIALAIRYIFVDNNQKTLLMICVIFIYYFLAEIIFMGVLALLFKVDSTSLIANWKGHFWTDGIISIIALGISLIPAIKTFSLKLINIKVQHHYLQIILCVICGIGIFGTKNGLAYGENINYFVNLLLILIFVIIIFYLFKEREYSTELSGKYEQLINYIEKYEKEITKKSMLVHEFKNQIISIKGFVNKKDMALNDYLNSIVSDVNKNESETLKNMENLPKGGLKGLIYYKLGYLEEEKFKILLDISPSTKKSPFSKINSNVYNDILKVIGVYLDNAIESSKSSNKKEIVLEMYFEKEIFNFILSNTYNKPPLASKLGRAGYSTKGRGRGYGLLLSNSIVQKNECIGSKTEITAEYFTQYLTVDFKKHS